jgi:hypothetical protein
VAIQYKDSIIKGQKFRGNADGALNNVEVTVDELCNLKNDKYDIMVIRSNGKKMLLNEDTFRQIFVKI